MPTINIEPKAMQNGDNVTTYKDTVGPQQQTYTFLTSQERVILKNSGSKNITYTVGSQSGTLGPSQTVDVKETISSINLTAEQGTQQFEIWADESGTKGTSPEAVQSLGDQVSGFASSLADKASKLKTDVWIDAVSDFGASGSAQTTTANTTSGSNIITVTNPIDFKVGQGIRIDGSPCVVNMNITGGATANGNMKLTLNNFNYLRDIWGVTNGTSASGIASLISSTYWEGFTTSVSGTTVTFNSTGNWNSPINSLDAGTTGVTATFTLTTAGVPNFISKITAINGNNITLQDTVPFTTTGRNVWHDDTVAIQAAMDASVGKILDFPNGTYYISSTLIPQSNQHLRVDKRATIKIAPGSMCNFIKVSNSISNFTIDGGTWDGSGQYVTRTTGYNGKGFYFKSASYLLIQNIKIKETREWGIGHFGTTNFVFRNIEFDQLDLQGRNGDGITGQCLTNGLYENIYGYTNDDMIHVGAGTDFFSTSDPIQSDTTNITIRNITLKQKNGGTTYAWRAIQLSALNGKRLSKVTIDGVKGTTQSCGILIENYNTSTGVSYMSNIHINDITCNRYTAGFSTVVGTYGIVNINNITVDNLTIGNMSRIEDSLTEHQVYIDSSAVISSLDISNVNLIWKNSKTGDVVYDKGSVSKINFSNITSLDTTNNARMNIYNKNSTDTVTVTRITGSGIHTGGTSGENVYSASGKLAINSPQISVVYTRNTPNQWDIIADPFEGLRQYDGVNWKSLQKDRGYLTTSSGATANQWTKIANVTLTASAQRSLNQISIIGGNNGDSTLPAQVGIVYFRVQQQNALGSAPNIEVDLNYSQRMSVADVMTVTTQNDATATSVDLYVRIVGNFETLSINPIHTAGNVNATYFSTQSVSTTLPTGTQTAAKKMNVVVTSTTSTSASNLTIFEESGVLKYKDSTGVVKTVTLA
jgi:hypothetical protein